MSLGKEGGKQWVPSQPARQLEVWLLEGRGLQIEPHSVPVSVEHPGKAPRGDF